ncbi:heterodisulfide reductase-related iron-sulfur binding cluster [Thermodesulforhabdus norvegica]|uniref:Heterodisulfide reductase subunit B n=1 Tax=Thermodesulforhabdus norvegica TaxID=39841 RepID=A0A1I4V9A9_9BACT|nr:heterodisulfide reductase-related iron-sulfur binding cluster [Thermodesulforhabdus norvegica]SFM97786.1 heterodisulfide reductase subunit B [Thermodesulforhabdus norvegica]
MPDPSKDLVFFPGCSLASSARENYASLQQAFWKLGFRFRELDDWNCCGSAATGVAGEEIDFLLSARNLTKVPPGKTLLVACPKCWTKLHIVQRRLKEDPEFASRVSRLFGTIPEEGVRIVHYLEVLTEIGVDNLARIVSADRENLRCALYFGCTRAQQSKVNGAIMFDEQSIQSILENLGVTGVKWPHVHRCCGTYLTGAIPEIVEELACRIVNGAAEAGAEAIITVCAMCHFNLETRGQKFTVLPILHFTEILSIALGIRPPGWWFRRHLVSPVNLLKKKGWL